VSAPDHDGTLPPREDVRSGIIEFPITAGKEEPGAFPAFFVKNEYFALRILRSHFMCFVKRLFVCPVCLALGIVIEIITIAMDDADY